MQIGVSIIVPCFNYGHLLGETLQSLQKQSYRDWECIIIDDGSIDNTAQIAGEFCTQDKRFIYIYQSNQGLAAARNAGISNSRGTFIQFLDADDLLSPGKLAFQVDYMLENEDVGISYTDAFYFPNDNPQIKHRAFYIDDLKKPYFKDNEWIPKLHGSGKNIIEFLLWSNIAPVNSFLIQKEVLMVIGFFNIDYKYLEDWDMWARAALSNTKFSFAASPEAYALIRVHNHSMTFNSMKMEVYFLKLQQDILTKLSLHNKHEFYRILSQNKKKINAHIKSLIQKYGVYNFEFLRALLEHMKFSTFIKLYTSVLNKHIRNKK